MANKKAEAEAQDVSPTKERKKMTDGQLELHVMKRVEDWLSKLRPQSRRRVTSFVADRSAQLDREEAAALNLAGRAAFMSGLE